MVPTFPEHDSFGADIRTGHNKDGKPLIYVGNQFFDIPDSVIKKLASVTDFKKLSRQDQIKAHLHEMLKAAR